MAAQLTGQLRDDDIQQTLGLDRQRGTRWRWVAALLFLPLLALLLYGGFAADPAATPSYRTVPVVRGGLTLTVTATGTLQPLNQVEVGSELSGTIASVAVDFNDQVKAGAELARLDTSTLENRIVEGRASLQAAEARVQEALATEREMAAALNRCRELARQQMCAPHDLDAAQAAHARASAGVSSARAQVAIAQAALDGQLTNLAKATIRSPIDGIVLDRKVEPGQTVAASFQTPVLFTLAEDLARMELLVAVDEADIGRVRPGQRAGFSVDAFPDRPFSATITQVRRAPQTVEGVVSYQTVLGVENAALQLHPGMTATAEIVTREVADALLIPNAALRYAPPPAETKSRAGGGSLLSQLFPRPTRTRPARPKGEGAEREVWLLRDGEPQPLTIKVGESDGVHTEVMEGGLEPGMALITESVQAPR
ncbi:MAG: efflux RND transporter periplasmic adaptor subunit [Gammaproteobacteria bacterium]|nr:efflux RND transporter periplasmic adaptor subunit [Gammaproteobacteria bacterium]